MIYTLVLTMLVSGYHENSVSHVEHDYSTQAECHQAYQIARAQLELMSDWKPRIAGTCLAHQAPMGAKPRAASKSSTAHANGGEE